VLTVEIPGDVATPDVLGLAIARILATCDHLADESARLVWPDGHVPAPDPGRPSRGEVLLHRYAMELAELLSAPATLGDRNPGEAEGTRAPGSAGDS